MVGYKEWSLLLCELFRKKVTLQHLTPLYRDQRQNALDLDAICSCREDFAAEVLGELLDAFELINHVSGDHPMVSLADSLWNGSGQGREFVRVLLHLGSVDAKVTMLSAIDRF